MGLVQIVPWTAPVEFALSMGFDDAHRVPARSFHMDRRDFLKSTGAAAAFAAGANAAASAPITRHANWPQTREIATTCILWDVSIPWSLEPAGFADEALRLAVMIEEKTGGQVRLHLCASDRPDHKRAAASFGPIEHLANVHPGFGFFAGLPGSHALAPHDLEGWLSLGGGQRLWDDLAAAQMGAKLLLAGHTGPAPVLWLRKPLSDVADLAGLRVLAHGLLAEVVRGLGAEPIAVLTVEEALDAIRMGAVDAAEWGNLVQAHAAGIPAQLPFGYAGALRQSGGTLALNVPLQVWNELDSGLQGQVADAAAARFRQAVLEERSISHMTRQALSAHGVTLAEFDRPVQSALDRVAAAVVAHAAHADPRAAAINASYMQYLRNVASGSDGLAATI
jgi:TRAP-type mannitol/chloroaromatic compound transport system substrate-binding protein